MNLKGRVERLEEAMPVTWPLRDIFIRSVSPEGPREVARIQYKDQVWHRLAGEAEEALRERAAAEAAEPLPHCARLFVCIPASEE